MERATQLPAAAELVQRIEWLIRLRWLAVLGVVCTIEAARRVLGLVLALGPLYAVTAALAAYNLALTLVVVRIGRLRRPAARRGARARLGSLAKAAWRPALKVGAREAALLANVQISLDLIILAWLLHFSGGIENPFILFFTFHVIIASILLSPLATFAQATLGLALISAVGFGECVGLLRHYPLGLMWTPEGYRNAALVAIQLSVFGVTIYLVVYMGTAIARTLRGRERQVVLLSTQVSEKARLLEAAVERIRETERLKSQYMRKVAHELRGPLGTIKTALQVVLGGTAGEIADGSRDLISRAERRAGELAELTRDLLVLARAREGGLAAETVPVDVADVVLQVVAEMQTAADRAGVALNTAVPPEGCEVIGDAAAIQQLASNLVSNAIRYTPAGGEVTVRLSPTPRSLRLEVSDTGVGIPAEDLPRIFEDFYRSANARELVPEGTGLGLSIVKAVAERHGGSVTVASRPGSGTTFTVDLPIEPTAGG